MRWLASVLGALVLLSLSAAGEGVEVDELLAASRLKLGVGDRMQVRVGRRWISQPAEALEMDLDLDLFELWLPRGWKDDWVERSDLLDLAAKGITPVVVHYYFGDEISRERVETSSDEWFSSMWRMASLIRMDAPVLVVLEPEFNNAPPNGETAITSWPWFGDDLRSAAKMIRKVAPNALVGVCPGDFAGTPNLEAILGPVTNDLDFLAFQEMRASTDRSARRAGYLDVAGAAVDYARYLKRAFDLPILIAYVAVSSHGGWEQRQAETLRGFGRRRRALREAGVFGLVYFQLRDDPRHHGYFGAAERSFGLLRADGTAKPALTAFRALRR